MFENFIHYSTKGIESVMILGLIVVIRTFLSFSIGIELEGKLPWRNRDAIPKMNQEGL